MRGRKKSGKRENGKKEHGKKGCGKAALLFLAAALMTACKGAEETRPEWPVPMVTVVSGEETYLPIEDFNYAEETDPSYGGDGTIAVNGGYLAISDVWGMPKVPYRPDLEVRAALEADQVWCRLWDEDGQAMTEDGEVGLPLAGSELPEPEPGKDYTVELQMRFGEAGSCSGYQYFFQVTAEEQLPKLRLTCSSDEGEKEIPTEQGAGAFPVLMGQEELPVLSRDGVIGLSFGEGTERSDGTGFSGGSDLPAETAPVEEQVYSVEVYSVDLTHSGSTGEMILAEMGKEDVPVDPEKLLLPLAELGLDETGDRKNEEGGMLCGLLIFCRFADGREGYYAAAAKLE